MSHSFSDAPRSPASRRAGLLGRVWGAFTGRNAAEAEAKRLAAIWGIGPNGVQTRDPAERIAVRVPLPELPVPVEREANAKVAETRLALEVPFADKDQAKALGARWDRTARAWYAPAGIDHAPFEAWLPGKAQPVDPVEQFAEALRRAGLRVERPEMDGKLHRVAVEGDRGRDRSGAYKGYLDGRPAGFIENFKTGERLNWKASGQPVELSAEDRERLTHDAAERQRERLQERERGYEQAAAKAEGIWATAEPLAPRTNVHEDARDYLEAKGVQPHGVRHIGSTILVPVRDADGKLQSLQTIGQDGSKQFMPDGRVESGSFVIGDVRQPGPLLIAEGFSTAATVHELTGHAAIVAFNAGNLPKVAQAYRERFPGRSIYIAGDDDREREASGKPNVGREKAEEAAASVGGRALFPAFPDDVRGTDWNDLARSQGREAAQLSLLVAIRCAEREQMVAEVGAARLSERSLDREPVKGRQRENADLER